MLTSQLLDTVGLAFDIVGFTILFLLAYPAVMRRDFVTADQLGMDGPDLDPTREMQRLLDPDGKKLRDARYRTLTTTFYIVGGSLIVLGFGLQIGALYMP